MKVYNYFLQRYMYLLNQVGSYNLKTLLYKFVTIADDGVLRESERCEDARSIRETGWSVARSPPRVDGRYLRLGCQVLRQNR